ncbi:MAG TPA: DUF4838 domain-containing protein [Opitutaceae bacterium]
MRFPAAALLGFAVAAAAPLERAAEAPIELARGGHSLATIVVNHGSFASAEEASAASDRVDWFGSDERAAAICTESFAAVELRHYLCLAAGLDASDPTQFPIRGDRESVGGTRIIVGSLATNHAGAGLASWIGPGQGPESYRIKAVRTQDGPALVLAGADRVGTLYAVYAFLGRLGVRWFSPGIAGEVVPAVRDGLEWPWLDMADGPKFAIRGYWAEFFSSENEFVRPVGKKGTPDFFDWMARNRMNLWSSGEEGVPPGEMKKRGLHLSAGGHTFYTLIDPDAPYPYRHPRFPGGPADLPPDPYAVSPDFKGDANGDGVLSYSEAHPEWYGLGPDGQRHFTRDPFGYNFCTSNKDMRAEFLKNLVTKLSTGAWRYADYLDWWPEDADNWCVCDNCKALGSPTDRNLIMADFIREGLKQALADGRLHRDIKVKFLIYSSAGVIEPPTRPLPKTFDYDGIMGTFFPIYRCYVHDLDDPNCTEFNQRYFRYLNAWRTSPYYRGKFMIGEYYNISYFRDLPILFTRTMEHDIRFYYDSGARAMHYMHISMGNWGPRALTNVQFARMLWDPHVDVAALKDDYMRARYEDAAPVMARFYASLEQAMLNVPEYLATPGEEENLGGRLRAFSEGKTKDLFPYRHLRLTGDHPPPDDGPSIEDSIRELGTTERLIREALAVPVSARARGCILEDEALFRYGDATVRLYYHMARAAGWTPRSADWTREMRQAVIQADYLDAHPISFVAVYGGTKDMVRNALECTGIRDVYLRWKAMMP